MGFGGARQAHYRRAHDECLEAKAPRVLAECRGGDLVLADRLERPAPGAVQQPLETQKNDADQHRHERQVDRVVEGRAVAQLGEGARDEGNPERSAGDAVGILRHGEERCRDAKGGDRKIVAAQPQRRDTDDCGRCRCGSSAAEPADRDRQTEAAEMLRAGRRRQDRRHIGADGDETGNAGIEQPGEAPLQVEAEADQREAERRHQEEDGIACQIEHHDRPPNKPVGLTMRTTSSTRNATAVRYSAPTNGPETAPVRPMTRLPTTAPGTLPMPPRITAAKSGRRRSKPMPGLSCTVTPTRTPAAAASAPPISQTLRTTPAMSMPAIWASCGFSAVARIARPRCVRLSSRWTPTTSTAVTASTT